MRGYKQVVHVLESDNLRELAAEVMELASKANGATGVAVFWRKKDKVLLVTRALSVDVDKWAKARDRYEFVGVYTYLADKRDIYADLCELKTGINHTPRSQLEPLLPIARAIERKGAA
jgi:hypothetical protein